MLACFQTRPVFHCLYIYFSIISIIFLFTGFPIQKLNSRVLHLHVFDYDRFSRDDSIGEVHIPLCQVSPLTEQLIKMLKLKLMIKMIK